MDKSSTPGSKAPSHRRDNAKTTKLKGAAHHVGSPGLVFSEFA